MTKGFVEVSRAGSHVSEGSLGQRQNLELQWLVCDEDSRSVLAWVGYVSLEKSNTSRRGIRSALAKARNQVKKLLKSTAARPQADQRLRGFVMFDIKEGVVDASPGLSTWASSEVVAAHLCGLAEHTRSGFEASIEGATLHCERLSRRSNLQIGWVREDRAIELSPESLLTPAQRRVAEYAVEGATCAEISRTLEASVETVRSHMKEIYRRLGVCCRAELTQLLVG